MIAAFVVNKQIYIMECAYAATEYSVTDFCLVSLLSMLKVLLMTGSY